MHIRYLTRSTRKVRNGEARNAGKTTLCCPPPIHSRLSEQSKASRFLSPLSCRLSSFCWAVNRLPYIWTRSGVVFCPLSPRPQSPCQLHRVMAFWVARAKGTYSMYISIVNPLRTYIHTYIHTYIQAQPQTKAPLAPTAPAQLWASC